MQSRKVFVTESLYGKALKTNTHEDLGAQRDQKRYSDPQELELKFFANCLLWMLVGKWKLGPQQERHGPLVDHGACLLSQHLRGRHRWISVS